MRVRCVQIISPVTRKVVADHPSMRVGVEYTVLEVAARPGGDSSLRIHHGDESPGIWDSAMFETTDPTVPSVWVAQLSDSGSLRLAPPRWLQRGFWERYFDDEHEAVGIFEADLAAILRESGGVDWDRHRQTVLVRISDELREVVREAEGSLGAREVEDLRDLIEVGEPGSAFELLCRQLHEYEAAVTPRMLESLRKLGMAMHLEARQWEILRVSESGR